MKLEVIRKEYTDTYTAGEMLVDGKFFSYTLEDTDRLGRGEAKVKGETCIPKGIYKVIISMSNRFKKDMPLLLDVPQFDGIRIHSGNTHQHTHGCILVGMTMMEKKGILGMSLIAFNLLMNKLKGQKDIIIEIK
jgi:hypothetical protein